MAAKTDKTEAEPKDIAQTVFVDNAPKPEKSKKAKGPITEMGAMVRIERTLSHFSTATATRILAYMVAKNTEKSNLEYEGGNAPSF